VRRAWRSLRTQLAVLGFLAIYVPVLLLFGVTFVTKEDQVVEVSDGVEVATDKSTRSPELTWTVVGLAPAAALLAWWWAGRAVRPIERVRAVAEEIEESDLSRRIGLDRGPTELVSLAASFDAMLDRLERAARTQRELIDETSHELRTPLAVLATNADVLLAHPEPTAELYREGLERSRSAALRLQTTIDELLAAARRRARTIDRRPADLMAIARRLTGDARVLASATEVELSLTGPSTATCSLDGPSIGRALANLVDNAIRHAPSGSEVAVAVEVTETEAVVAVSDHGPGIPSDEQEHVFERFWRGQGEAPGTGLGLPMAKQIALAHGGDLTLQSPGPAGDGCVFRLSVSR
jgi:signal transduction histidine kinase